jgi:hypothetical protein
MLSLTAEPRVLLKPVETNSWIAPAGFFVVQSNQIHRLKGGFELMRALNSK